MNNPNDVIVSLDLSVQDVNLILNGLQELPFKTVIELVQRIERDANAQITKLQQPPVDEKSLKKDLQKLK